MVESPIGVSTKINLYIAICSVISSIATMLCQLKTSTINKYLVIFVREIPVSRFAFIHYYLRFIEITAHRKLNQNVLIIFIFETNINLVSCYICILGND